MIQKWSQNKTRMKSCWYNFPGACDPAGLSTGCVCVLVFYMSVLIWVPAALLLIGLPADIPGQATVQNQATGASPVNRIEHRKFSASGICMGVISKSPFNVNTPRRICCLLNHFQSSVSQKLHRFRAGYKVWSAKQDTNTSDQEYEATAPFCPKMSLEHPVAGSVWGSGSLHLCDL